MRSRSIATNMRTMMLQGQAALLALVFVAGQLGSQLHAVSERHVRCPEHGELVHVDALPLAATASGIHVGQASDEAPGQTSGEVDALRKDASGADGHEHDHCYLCPVSRERLGTIPNAGTSAAALPAEIACSLPAVVAPSGRPRYVIAPKTSPPL